MKSSRFQKLLTALIAGAVLLVATNAWLAFHAEQVLARSEFGVIHTLRVITGLERALREASDTESNARGYMLTGQARFLAAYTQASRALPTQIAHLERLTADNPSQAAQLKQAEGISTREVQLLQGTVLRGPRDKAARQQAIYEIGEGLDMLLRLNGIVTNLEQNVRITLASRLQESARARNEAKLTVALASALDVLFIILASWTLGYERRMRDQARRIADRLQRLQTISDVTMGQLPLAEMTREMLSRLKNVANADAVALYAVRPGLRQGAGSGTRAEVMASAGIELTPGSSFELRPGGPLDRATTGDAVVRLSGDQVHELPDGEFTHDMGTLLILPLISRESMLGLLVAGQSRTDAFEAEDEELLRLVAERMASSIDRVNLFEGERAARTAAEQNAAEVQLLNEELEQRVLQRTAELEATNRELEAFSYSVSHDLRAPLRSIDGFSVALLEDYGPLLEGEGTHYLTRIRVGVQRMGQLIDSLLQLSRITRSEIVPEPVDLSALAASVAEDVRHAWPERSLHFTIEPELHAECDPRLMRVVFENMFGNAAKFTGKREEGRVEFGWSPERKAYFIRDNGAGFDQQYAGKLFVAFQRLHGDKDFQGSGIGLATVARVIRRHHGTLAAEGVVDTGATFWFTLGAGSL